MKNFKKSDLRTGMLILKSDHKVGMVINNNIIFESCSMSLDTYNSNMKDEHPDNTIIKVSNVLESVDLIPENWTKRMIEHNLLWEREKEIPELTVGEIIQKLGYEIKIKK